MLGTIKTAFDSVVTELKDHNIYFTSFFFPTEKICDKGFYACYSSNMDPDHVPLEMMIFHQMVSDVMVNFETHDIEIRKRLLLISNDIGNVEGFINNDTVKDFNVKDEYDLLFADKVKALSNICKENDYNFFFNVVVEVRDSDDGIFIGRQTVGSINDIQSFGNVDLKTLAWHKCLLFQSLALHMLLPEDQKEVRALNLKMLQTRILVS